MLRPSVVRWGTGASLAAVLAAAPLCAQDEPAAVPPEASPLAVEPTTVEGDFDAALLMVKLARLKLARWYLEQLQRRDPTDEQLLALRDAHGTGTFLELSRVEELNPPATQLLKRLSAAVERQAGQPDYVENILRRLSGTPREHAQAVLELQHLGARAVPAILKNLDGQLGVDRGELTVTLTRLGTAAIDPLIGAIPSPDDNVRTVAAEVLGRIGGESTTVWLWAPAFADGQPPGVQIAARQALAQIKYGSESAAPRVTSDGATRRVLKAAMAYLNGSHPWPESDANDPNIVVWTWDSAAGTVVDHPVSRQAAGAYFAERLGRDAAALAPSNDEAPVIVLAALLTHDIQQAGWDHPVPVGPGTAHDLALRSGPEVCERVLRLALDQHVPEAALGSVEALAQNGSPEILQRPRGESALTAALDAPWPRVQFAAATAILQWDPVAPFRGSSRVVEILARALLGSTQPVSVVMDPNVSRGTMTAGLLQELGYESSVAATGKDGFRLAASHGNVELAVLHPNVIRWELSQTLANLRADARTATIPVVVYGPPEVREQVLRQTGDFQRVAYINESTDAVNIHRDLEPLLAQSSPPPLTPVQRGEQQREAAFWLQRIAVRNVSNVFDLAPAEESLVSALNQPRLAEDVLVALTGIGRPSVQTSLLSTATSMSFPPETRQLAALQLATHIQRFGRLLTPAQITTLQNGWANEQDPVVRTALAGVIGSLQPAPEAARREILSRPLSSAPAQPSVQ